MKVARRVRRAAWGKRTGSNPDTAPQADSTILVFASRVWSGRDKLISALLLLLPILVPSVAFIAATGGGENAVPPGQTGPAGEKAEDPSLGFGPAELYLFVAGLPSALYLGWRLRRGDPATSPKES